MKTAQPDIQPRPLPRLRAAFARRFSLRDDQAPHEEIDSRIRGDIELRGATPWILMFAIFIASVGLNVNSAAAIIGAMLISPLMGPIMGIGYGVAIYDFTLIRRALSSLAIATGLSIMTSTLYFAVTPLSQAQTELLARTTPTIWDVLIALFGGLAGSVAATRKKKSNVIPGVAIATALMPPLCTVGYGLAHMKWEFVVGAFYLFSINSVFIAVSMVLVTGFLHLPHRNFVDGRVERRVKTALLVIVLATTIPSAYLAFGLVRAEVFRTNAQAFIKREFQFKHTSVVALALAPDSKTIEVTLTGDPIKQLALDGLKDRLANYRLAGAALVVHQGASQNVDVAQLKEGVLADLYRTNIDTLRERDVTILELRGRLDAHKKAGEVGGRETASVLREVHAQYPTLRKAMMGYGRALTSVDKPDAASGTAGVPGIAEVPFLSLTMSSALSRQERARLERWFKARVENQDASVTVNIVQKGRNS